MATIQDLGKVAYLQKGAYNSSTKYEVNDVVTYQGSSYVSKVNNNQGNLPTNTTYWAVVVEKPVKGVDYFTQADKQEMVDEITEDAESEFNQNAQAKTEAFNSNASDKTGVFNNNATSKTNDFNSNASSKTTTFNNNATSKTTDYDTNASNKISDYNTNATNKTNAFDEHVTDKIDEFDEHVEDKTDEFDLHVAMLEEDVEDLRDNQLFNDAEEKEIYIEDAAKARVYDFELSKESTQDVEPTPENPVEVKTVKGYRNLFDVDTFINNAPTYYSKVSDSQISVLKNYTTAWSDIPNLLNVKENQIYYLSFESDSNIDVSIQFLNNLNEVVGNVIHLYQKGTFITPNTATSFKMKILNRNNNYPFIVEKFQIVEGYQEHSYVPYGNNYADVKVVGKNFFNKDNLENGYYTGSGVKTSDTGYNKITTNFIKITSNTIISFSANVKIYSLTIYEFDANQNWIKRTALGRSDPKTVLTITTTANTKYIKLGFNYNQSSVITEEMINSLQLQAEYGNARSTYDSYKETNVPIPLNDNEIVGKGTNLDEYIVDKNGKCYLNKVFNKIDSYNGETITTPYLSTTGGLDTGATIYYVRTTPQLIDLNTTVDLRLFKGINNITNSEDANMKIRYVQSIQDVIDEIKNAILEIGGGE